MKIKENHTCMKMGWNEDSRTLEPMRYDTISKTDGDCALHVSCSLVQLARVVVCVLVLVVVLCVMIVVLNAHMDVVHAEDIVLVTIFVMIFCNWKCTLYTFRRFHAVQRMWRTFEQNGTRANCLH